MIKRLGAFFLDVLEVIVFAVGIFFFIYLLIMRPHKISGQSMMPNFQDAEFLLTEKVSYYTRGPNRGDVVVFMPPVSDTDEFIKRVVGLPGERIMIKDGRIYINERLLQESYIGSGVVTSGGPFLGDNKEYFIPDGQYFVLGDNRPNSSDSRYWGPITKKMITGRAWIAYWPVNIMGVVQKPSYNF
jgi:signal peptidase I